MMEPGSRPTDQSSPEPMLVQVEEQHGTCVQDVLPHRLACGISITSCQRGSDHIVLVEIERPGLLGGAKAAPEELLREDSSEIGDDPEKLFVACARVDDLVELIVGRVQLDVKPSELRVVAPDAFEFADEEDDPFLNGVEFSEHGVGHAS